MERRYLDHRRRRWQWREGTYTTEGGGGGKILRRGGGGRKVLRSQVEVAVEGRYLDHRRWRWREDT